MKKLTTTLLVAVLAVLTVSVKALDPPITVPVSSYFTITNKTTNEVKTAALDEFTSLGLLYDVTFSNGVCNGDQLEISYKPALSAFAPQLTWSSAWLGNSLQSLGTGLTVNVSVKDVPQYGNTLLVKCNYQGYGSSSTEVYTFNFPNVRAGNRVTVKSSDASEVQVSYRDYEEVATGQRAAIALYDIYGNGVSCGYLDSFGMGTLSTKGKSGIYIVKVMMDNRVIFSQRIQVK